MAKTSVKQLQGAQPLKNEAGQEMGRVGKGCTVVFFEQDGKHMGRIEFELDTVRIAPETGVNKRTGVSWERVHSVLAKIGAVFGKGYAWFDAGLEEPVGVNLQIVLRGESERKVREQRQVGW